MSGRMDYTAEELFNRLNETDDCSWIEAKGGSCSSRAVMETVCSFCNEPNLGGGYILLGVAEDESSADGFYKIVPLKNSLDKFQADFASQCNELFNIPVRPQVSIEKIAGQTVIKIRVEELPPRQKPLYFKAEKLPAGALRRIGTADIHCSEEDLAIFYSDTVGYDLTPVPGATLNEVDEKALERYRILRKNVYPQAEELLYSDRELLASLGCLNRSNSNELNLAGVLLFGTPMLQRRVCPMHRIDYIRVPGNEWVQNPNERFVSIDMRGSLLLMLYRLIDAVNVDLPKGFLLNEGDIQASSIGLPLRVLREALVNSMTHRSYRENRPTQVIRYDNRIEIINAGYSLKPEDELGQPGSVARNQVLSTVFHETNLAENKGSGISVMQKLMSDASMALPTFESNHQGNTFTIRLLLHHFLGQKDLEWLENFADFPLNNHQKTALIFVREIGAIDNLTYRQMSGVDTLKASFDLRTLKEMGILCSKGKSRSTYYIFSPKYLAHQSQGKRTRSSSEAKVTSSVVNATSSNAKVTSSNAKVTSSDAKVTSSGVKVTSSDAKVTSSEAAKVTSSDANATSSVVNATSSVANATSSVANATSSDANATSSVVNATSSVANATSSVANATSSDANATSSVVNATSSVANATSSVANATSSVANATSSVANATSSKKSDQTLPNELMARISQIRPRERDLNKIQSVIVDLCSVRPMKSFEIAELLKKSEYHIRTKFLSKMVASGDLQYLYPEMINHPNQAYITPRKERK